MSSQTLKQRSLLESFYNECGGSEWKYATHWLDMDVNICSWYGVRCSNDTLIDSNGERSVVAIELQDNKLKCMIPLEIFSLSYLETLDVSSNPELDMNFDEVENISISFKNLNAFNTGIHSVDGISSSMKGLESLVLRKNNISGRFPLEITKLAKLHYLDLSNNFFSGELPDEIENLKEIKGLNLAHNKFSGQIPSNIGVMVEIDTADLSHNAFTGTLPTEMNNLSKLYSLSLNDQLSSGITGPIIDFATQPNLRMLNLARNAFTGTLPETLMKSVDENSYTTMIDISSNKISGVIPSSLDRFFVLRIYASDNEIEGIDPNLCAQRNWFFNEVNFFGCNAILCPPSTFSLFGRQTSVGYPCQPCPNGIDGAPFYGSTNCEGKKATQNGAEPINPFRQSGLSFSTKAEEFEDTITRPFMRGSISPTNLISSSAPNISPSVGSIETNHKEINNTIEFKDTIANETVGKEMESAQHETSNEHDDALDSHGDDLKNDSELTEVKSSSTTRPKFEWMAISSLLIGIAWIS